MVNRTHIRCHACANVLVIRVTVNGGLQRFVFPCPYCAVPLSGSFYATPITGADVPSEKPPPFEIKSEDFDFVPFDGSREGPEMLAVAVNTELPVHVSQLAAPADATELTPFLRFLQLIDSTDTASALVQRINVLRDMRFTMLPSVRRAATSYARDDMKRLAEQLTTIPGLSAAAARSMRPWWAITAVLASWIDESGATVLAADARAEFERLLATALNADREATMSALKDAAAELLPEHRRSLVDTVLRALAATDALTPGLCLEAVPDLDLMAYRVQRSDFDELKTGYQDIFELGSRTITVPALLVNIAQRGDAKLFGDGKRYSIRQASKTQAYRREAWLAELPALDALLAAAKRDTRNLIGHRLVSYDYERAALIDDRGQEHNYLLFLRDYLGAVRTCGFLLYVAAVLTDIDQAPEAPRAAAD